MFRRRQISRFGIASQTHRSLPALRAAALVLGILLAASRAAAQPVPHGRYLASTADSVAHTYGGVGGGGNPLAFDRAVVDSTKNINAGAIRFDYDTYVGDPDGTTLGGAALSGGFFMNPGVTLKPGFSLAWVQTVLAGRTGQNDWNLPQNYGSTFPDATPLTPAYPFTTTAFPAVPAPTLGFQDYPGRIFDGGNTYWRAELGLVCMSNTPNLNIGGLMFREVRVIDTFTWGFDLVGLPPTPPAVPGIGNVQPHVPGNWSDPSAVYLNTLNEFYDGSGGGPPPVASNRFRFFNNDNCFVPEPAALVLLAFGGLAMMRRRR